MGIVHAKKTGFGTTLRATADTDPLLQEITPKKSSCMSSASRDIGTSPTRRGHRKKSSRECEMSSKECTRGRSGARIAASGCTRVFFLLAGQDEPQIA
jgi:hypothetical protein